MRSVPVARPATPTDGYRVIGYGIRSIDRSEIRLICAGVGHSIGRTIWVDIAQGKLARAARSHYKIVRKTQHGLGSFSRLLRRVTNE
jgi:hypothetical protein